MAKQPPDPPDYGRPVEGPVISELILLELSHRVRNIFSVVSGMVALSARGHPEIQPFARALQARIDALAVAYGYFSPQIAAFSPPSGAETVKGLLRALTAPYQGERATAVVVDGEDAAIRLRAAGALSLIIHELATNAVKHGAFSSETGTVTLSCAAAEGRYTILWREDGGPPLSGPPSQAGFGMRFCERLAAAAGIDVLRSWRPEGLEVSISMPLEALDA